MHYIFYHFVKKSEYSLCKLARENEARTAGNKKEAEDRKKGVPVPQA